jgi:hypothetical protein
VRAHERASAEQLAAERVAVELGEAELLRDVGDGGGVVVGVVAHVHQEAVQPVRAQGGEQRIDRRARGVHRAGGHEVLSHQLEIVL